ncbi:MAG: hypothetical protein QNJ47_08755 [Nostocaceae cyanobacterium]|nr:hypothetical protein [Nostocaceae cyanobacterium]
MNKIINWLKIFTLPISALVAMSSVAIAQDLPTIPQQTTTQRLCSSDPVEDLLPRPQSKPNDSLLSYLAEEGFVQHKDGSWICYANDPQEESRYYSLFKVQQVDGKFIGSSFLDKGSLIEGQESRSLDFFMTLIEHHMNTSPDNREGIRRYLSAFISLVQQKKIQPSRRGYLFDQPHQGLVLYHDLKTGKLQGTAITINIQSTSESSIDDRKN